MARNQKDFTYDNATRLKDAGAVTTTGADQVGGSAQVLDLGAGRVDARVIVDISALTVGGASPENYQIVAQFSNSSSFASGVVNGASVFVGSATPTNQSANTAAPARVEIGVTNEINGTIYRYMRTFRIVAGTAPSINYVANLALEA